MRKLLCVAACLLLSLAALAEERPPAPLPDDLTQALEKLVAKLGADDFETREAATQKLMNLEAALVETLEKMRTSNKDPEVAARLAKVIARFKPAPPKSLELPGAKVLAVRPEVGLVMVSIGTTHGVKPGQQLAAFRDGKWIRRMQVDRVYPDMCSAKVIGRGAGEIQVHDEIRAIEDPPEEKAPEPKK